MLVDAVKGEFLEHAQQELSTRASSPNASCSWAASPTSTRPRSPRAATPSTRKARTCADMVRENLIAERIAIDSYREMINWIGDRDTTTKRILEHILAQEEEHADDMADLLDGSDRPDALGQQPDHWPGRTSWLSSHGRQATIFNRSGKKARESGQAHRAPRAFARPRRRTRHPRARSPAGSSPSPRRMSVTPWVLRPTWAISPRACAPACRRRRSATPRGAR